MPTPTTPLLSLPLELRHAILLRTHNLDTNTLTPLLDQRISAQNHREQRAITRLECCEHSKSNDLRIIEKKAEEALKLELIQQERLVMRARKRVRLVCRQVAQDMEYVTGIWMKEIEEFKERVGELKKDPGCGVCELCELRERIKLTFA